ncbi:MAG: hypothetical protein AYK19_15435 [Theionarchaea archaeon DG-70-1]|nr:MAG: hypothetical protein AYK19_15435 [Theionarchaea archaeon DG-70-1]
MMIGDAAFLSSLPSPAWKKMLCVLLWILGVILAFGIRRYAVGGSALLALSGLLLILAVYLKGL